MTFSVQVLSEKAAMRQRKKLQEYKEALEKASGLEELFHDACVALFPKPSDYDARRDLIRIFNEIIKEICDCSGDFPCVVEFGSFSMDMFQAKSDLDLSVNFANEIPRDQKIQTLRMLGRKLNFLQRSGHVRGVKAITTARVPVLKVIDRGTGVECDISVGNMDGILKSKILFFISLIDKRFRTLCFLMKAWAKAHKINSAKDRTMNSLTIVLLVAFHLQTRSQPILPPFSAIFEDGRDAEAVGKSIHKFVNYGENNKESVAELFFTLLLMLSSVEKLWSEGLCVSTYEGSWIAKTWGDDKAGCINVEDFCDRSQNVARAVQVQEMEKINKCINHTIRRISDFLRCQKKGNALKGFLFGKDGAKWAGEVTKNCTAKSNLPCGSTIRIEDKNTTGGQKATQQLEDTTDSENATQQLGDSTGGENATQQPGDTTGGQNATQQPGDTTGSQKATQQPRDNTGSQKATQQLGDTSGGQKATQQLGDTLGGQKATQQLGDTTGGQKTTQQLGGTTGGQKATQQLGGTTGVKKATQQLGARGGQKATQLGGTTGGQKATLEHKGQSVQPRPYKTTLGKRMRTDGSSVPSNRLSVKPHIHGQMGRQRYMPNDMARFKPMENHGVMPLVVQGGTQYNWVRADQSIPNGPVYPNMIRHIGAVEKMHYSETHRAPYIPAPVSQPTPMLYPYPLHNQVNQPQMPFRAPNLTTPSVYSTFPAMANQMLPRHASQTVGNLPSTPNILGYPFVGPNSSFPPANYSNHEPARFR